MRPSLRKKRILAASQKKTPGGYIIHEQPLAVFGIKRHRHFIAYKKKSPWKELDRLLDLWEYLYSIQADHAIRNEILNRADKQLMLLRHKKELAGLMDERP